jgi:nucleoside-diphosphate-sugar epimerase
LNRHNLAVFLGQGRQYSQSRLFLLKYQDLIIKCNKMTSHILITGALGQIGSELVPALSQKYGAANIIASDISEDRGVFAGQADFIKLDATNKTRLAELIKSREITEIYHLAGILSATGEKHPDLAWDINITSLKNILDLSVANNVKQVFWPSSIAAFGPTTPKTSIPQQTILEPSTMYGVTKVAGELLGNYYFNKYGLDIRSLRYPGIISWKTPPGGGTTDYASAIYYGAMQTGHYDCFVRPDTILPMIYMADAVVATLLLMSVPPEKITVRTAYNLNGLSFSARQLAENVAKYCPGFTYDFQPDDRQKIADSWPQTIDDSAARADWGWQPAFDLDSISRTMLDNLRLKLKIKKDGF